VGDLLIVSGPPGAGKSAVAAAIADRYEPSVLIEGDVFFGFLRRGAIAPWRPEADPQNLVVAAATGAAAGRFAAGPATVVYDGVVGPWHLYGFLGHAGLVSCSYAVILPPLEQCLHQVRTRVGHGFTDEGAARHMHGQFAGATIDPRHVFTNPVGDFDRTVEAIVAAHTAGTLATLPL
jgi:hypothetical protein